MKQKKQHPVGTPRASGDSASKQTPAWALRISPRNWGLLLIATTLIAYWPALHGTLVWDDDSWTTNILGLLRSFAGLRLIWCNPIALQQYYPLTATSFWLDYHLWGGVVLPCHVENVLLHACAALLFWKLLTRLQVPGAWLAAALFALHPLMVESAGWITERKNVLSLVFYLGALLAYGRFTRFWQEDHPSADPAIESPPPPSINHQLRICNSPPRRWGAWALALFLLLAALFSKTTAFSFPAVVLLLCWWKRGRIRWRADVLPTLPFFALAIGLSQITAHLEKTHVGAQGPDWAISFPQRCLIAGRALWFYAGKLGWPAGLCFVYPRWKLDATSVTQWLYPLTALAVLLGLWLARKRIGRGPATAAFFYAGTLFPVLGFLNAFFMRYSFVSDHWAYVSSLGLFALGAALIVRLAARFRVLAAPYVFAAAVLPVLAVLTWRQCGFFTDGETLWRQTLARNPACPMAYNNLGCLLLARGRVDDAIVQYQKGLAIQPDFAEVLNNLGLAEAEKGQTNEAFASFQKALTVAPGSPAAHNNAGQLLFQEGRFAEAIEHYQYAIAVDPYYVEAHKNLADAFYRRRQFASAIEHYERVMALAPQDPASYNNVAWMLATCPDDSLRNGARALELARLADRLSGDLAPEMVSTVAAAYAELGRFPKAIAVAERGLKLAVAQTNADAAASLRVQIALAKSGFPFRDLDETNAPSVNP